MLEFVYPQMAWLLLLPLVVYGLLPKMRGMYGEALRVPFVKDFAQIEKGFRAAPVLPGDTERLPRRIWPLYFVWILLVLAAMRPILAGEPMRLKTEGRDILLVMDISTSMLEDDFSYQGRRLNRLTSVKAVASDFIQKRASDRIGLILFGTRAYLQAPLTYDHHAVNEILTSMDAGMAGNSTSIGDAVGLALKSFHTRSGDKNNKIIILLTDGENNDGSLSLPQAIALARQEGAKIYTIGVGGQGFSLANAFFGLNQSPLDEKSLQELAAATKGRYFRADNLNALVQIYREIDRMEPQSQEERFVYPRREIYYGPLLGAFLIAALLFYLAGRKRA